VAALGDCHSTSARIAEKLETSRAGRTSTGAPICNDGSHYYHYWLAALERLVTANGLTDRAALGTRKEVWAEAYRHAPHDKPVELTAGFPYLRKSRKFADYEFVLRISGEVRCR